MSLSITSAIVILFFVLLIFVFILYSLFRKKNYRIDAFWLLKNDREVARIVSSLSYLSAIKTRRSFISKKKINLVMSLKQSIVRHSPNSSSEDIDTICSDLLKIVERIKKKRIELIYK